MPNYVGEALLMLQWSTIIKLFDQHVVIVGFCLHTDGSLRFW